MCPSGPILPPPTTAPTTVPHTCPPPLVAVSCKPKCQTQCQYLPECNPAAGSPGCVPGCVCPPGTVADGVTCRKPSACQCVDDSEYIRQVRTPFSDY